MAHKLLVGLQLDVGPKFKGLVGPTDAVRGEICELSYIVTNVGTEMFPGGHVKSIRIEYGQTPGPYQDWVPGWDCPPLSVGAPPAVLKTQLVPMLEGLAWVNFSFNTVMDSQPVEYYQAHDLPGTAQWRNCFYVVNREILLLMLRLTK
jgi:hypothetical protein